MKKILLIIIILLTFKAADSIECKPNSIYKINTITITISNWELLPYKVITHETQNRTIFIGDNGNAEGFMHMWKIQVDEINRILGYNKYSYKDRWIESKCIEMFYIYQEYWNPEHDIETALRIWNSGPKGRFEQFDYMTENYINKFEL